MCINYEIVETRNPTSNAVTSPSQLAFTEQKMKKATSVDNRKESKVESIDNAQPASERNTVV